MKLPDPPMPDSTTRHRAALKRALRIHAAVLAMTCLFSTGCDMGTYNQRLKEKPVAPSTEEPAPETDSGTEAKPDAEDQSADEQ